MARTDPQVNFRIPAELNEKLKQAAAENNRTITSELVSRLESTFGDVEELRRKRRSESEYFSISEDISEVRNDWNLLLIRKYDAEKRLAQWLAHKDQNNRAKHHQNRAREEIETLQARMSQLEIVLDKLMTKRDELSEKRRAETAEREARRAEQLDPPTTK